MHRAGVKFIDQFLAGGLVVVVRCGASGRSGLWPWFTPFHVLGGQEPRSIRDRSELSMGSAGLAESKLLHVDRQSIRKGGRKRMLQRLNHQIVWMADDRMRPSRLMTGTPRNTAVAATIRSGMSGISARGTCRMASTTLAVKGASSIT